MIFSYAANELLLATKISCDIVLHALADGQAYCTLTKK